MIKTLLKSVREYKLPSILAPIFVTFEVIIEVIIPFIVAEMINDLQAGQVSMEVITKYGIELVILALVSLGCGSLSGIFAAKASSGFAKNLRKDVFYKVLDFSFINIDNFSNSSLVTRLTTDITNVQEAYTMLIRIAVRSPLMIVFSFIMAFAAGGNMAFMFVAVGPILAFALIMIGKSCMPLFKRVFKKYDKVNESIEENIKGIRVVKSFVREDFETQKFTTSAENLCVDFTKAERRLAYIGPVMQFCLNILMVLNLAIGSYIIITSMGLDYNVGQLSALLTYGFQILNSLMMFSMVIVMISISAESARRIVEVLNEKSTIVNNDNPIYEVKDGSVDFDSVSFKYSTTGKKNVLENIDLHIKSGETVGIIGGTGTSKTTLISLISRLYDVSVGEVKVGGINVKDYDVKTLRDNVAVVLQKNLLFKGTIKDNLRWGNENATDEEIVEACKLAQADSFINEFKDGYDYMISQGGTNVSGGQKQRLCIARALLKKPKILILDDSTSAVDTKTDALIREGFKSYIPSTTKIIIAQRIASVEDADKIVILDKGEINDIGTHEELINRNEIYKEVYYSQHNEGGNN